MSILYVDDDERIAEGLIAYWIVSDGLPSRKYWLANCAIATSCRTIYWIGLAGDLRVTQFVHPRDYIRSKA